MSIKLLNIKGIIFDCDGTLADTMSLHYESYKEAFKEFGLELKEEIFYTYAGGKYTEVLPKLIDNQLFSGTIEDIHERKKQIIKWKLDHVHIRPTEIVKLIPLFYGKYKLAVASSGSQVSVNLILKKLAIYDFFEIIVTSENLIRSKPDPEIFIRTSKLLNLKPEECFVFEDSQDGIEAACIAKMGYFKVYQ